MAKAPWQAVLETKFDALVTDVRALTVEFKSFTTMTREWETAMSQRLIKVEENGYTKDDHHAFEADHDMEFATYKKEHDQRDEARRKELEARFERRKMSLREWVMIALTLILAIATAGAWLK